MLLENATYTKVMYKWQTANRKNAEISFYDANDQILDPRLRAEAICLGAHPNSNKNKFAHCQQYRDDTRPMVADLPMYTSLAEVFLRLEELNNHRERTFEQIIEQGIKGAAIEEA